MALVALSAAVAVAGCGGERSSTEPTTRVSPDRLVITLRDGGGRPLRFDLDCAVADRDACSQILSAIRDAEGAEVCRAAPTDASSLAVSGTIAGDRVRSLLSRRTDCEIRTYDRAIDALGL